MGWWHVVPAMVLLLAACITGAHAGSSRKILQDRPSYCTYKPNYKPPGKGRPALPLHLEQDKFINSQGQPVNLHAVNIFGFNNHMTTLNGLWAGDMSAVSDFATIAYQLQLLGFNAVRLPFLFGDLKLPAAEIAGYCTGQSNLAALAARTTDPAYKGPVPAAAPKPVLPLFNTSTPGSCNKYIPGGQTLDRYLWTIQWFIANGWYVLIDFHPMGMETTSLDAKAFVESWSWLWSKVTCLPNYKAGLEGRLMIDLLNEPDSMWQGWHPQQGKPGITELYLGAMDAIWRMSPSANTIFFIEGGGQGNASMTINWGNGFITDKTDVAYYGISDPNPFFQTLMSKPYLKNVVIAPHVYGPSVTHNPVGWKGEMLWEGLDKSFGYLNKKGYCHKGRCQRFPIAIGEFGSRFVDAGDLEHLRDFTAWLRNEVPGHKDTHNAINNWFYWSWNANSGDTGGLVDDTWAKLQWVKLRFLQTNLGLKPWYLRSSSSSSTPPNAAAAITKPAPATPAAKPAGKAAAVQRAVAKPVRKPVSGKPGAVKQPLRGWQAGKPPAGTTQG